MVQIILNNTPVNYKLNISKRARRISISVGCEHGLIVTIPFGIADFRFEKFLHAKAGWILSKLDFVNRIKNHFWVKQSKGEYRVLKKQAQVLVTKKVLEWNKVYNFEYKNISIKNQKTRWGSCSQNKNLNFNYKIVHLPTDLLDYLIVHELCHLKELNHSKNFWQLVALAIPDYKLRRKALKEVHVVK